MENIWGPTYSLSHLNCTDLGLNYPVEYDKNFNPKY